MTNETSTLTSAAVDGGASFGAEQYLRGMELLLHTVQELSLARDLPSVQEIVRHAARQLTGCDGATFVLRDGDRCHYADEDAIAPLWKGKRFPMDMCISGWAMLNRSPAVIPDIYADPRIPYEAYRPTFVKSLVMVPIRTRDPIGAIGNYWAKPHLPGHKEVQLLQALADSISIALENIQLYQGQEARVRERTQQLQQAYDQIHLLSLTDELTGLYNRRGFMLLGQQALRHASRYHSGCALVFVDLDGLKLVNDRYGHEMGDMLINSAAQVLRRVFRESDIVARLGGDEFCVLVVDQSHSHGNLRQRLQDSIDASNAQSNQPFPLSFSIGIVEQQADSPFGLDDLLARADERMYQDKRSKRAPDKRGDAAGTAT